ncbi:MAG: adenosylcobinamide-GDP ribazoletransferase [Halothiobacillaceae bacterium]|nr:MAG: adenosylcobinamide-GDP ribazoletransferase [Halothiobacillaceae bacterium]
MPTPASPWRGLILATQFLTRLPTPAVHDFQPADLSRSAHGFPLVGLLVGGVVLGAGWAGARLDPWLGALSGLLAWVWVTGGLHIDGLADLFDGLGAAHRDPARLLAVMRDPHVGGMGALAMILQLLAKLVLLMLAVREGLWLVLLLTPAWARLGTLVWASVLPPLDPGLGERFGWSIRPAAIALWGLALMGASFLYAPALLLAPLVIAGWAWFLKRKVGGMSGDMLGAGTEVSESVLLLAACGVALA